MEPRGERTPGYGWGEGALVGGVLLTQMRGGIHLVHDINVGY